MKVENIFVKPKLIRSRGINFNHNKSLVYTRKFYRDFFVGDFL